MKLECSVCNSRFRIDRKTNKALKKGLSVVIYCPNKKCRIRERLNMRGLFIMPFAETARKYLRSRYMNEEPIMRRIFCEE